MFFGQTITIENPYTDLEQILPPNVTGWLGNQCRDSLTRTIKNTEPKIMVELGSWLGLSSIFIAKQLKPGAKLYCVDHWKGSIEHVNNPLVKTLYQQFLSNIIHAGLTLVIIPVKMTTLEAARYLKIEPDLIYLDASHIETDVFNDIMAWYPKLSSKGILCGDDYGWARLGYPSVKAAVDRAALILGKKVMVEGGTFWWLSEE